MREWRAGALASQWFPRLSGKPRPEAWQTGALRGSAWVAGLRGSSLTPSRGGQDCLRTPGVVAKRLTRMWKAQAESGGSSAASQPQTRPDAVPVSLPGSRAPGISKTGRPAGRWAALSTEGRPAREPNPVASAPAWGCLFLRHCCRTVGVCMCLCVSHFRFSVSLSHSVSFLPSLCRLGCVCVCVCVCVEKCARCTRKRGLACRPVSGEPPSASVPGSCVRLSTVFTAVPLWDCQGFDHVRRCVAPGALEISSPSRAASLLRSRRTQSSHGQKPHGSSLSCRRGGGPHHRRGLDLFRALL